MYAPGEEPKRALATIVLAAGLGTRMRSKTPKVLHSVCGRPMIYWVGSAVSALAPQRMLFVLGPGAQEVHQFLPQKAEVIVQQEQLGTGNAVETCSAALAGFEGDVMVMYGDTPLITAAELKGLAAAHAASRPACSLMTVDLDDPSHYGRVCRDADGRVIKIVEHRDANAEELAVCEINAGVYVFEAEPLWESLSEIDTENAQGEAYLTDVIEVLAKRSFVVISHKVDDRNATMGVNSRLDLAQAEKIMRRRILDEQMLAGVTIRDPESTFIDADVAIGRDTTLEPMTILQGATVIGEDCVIGPSTTLIDTAVDDGAAVVASFVSGARIGSGCNVGPFAYLRPGATLDAGAKAGTFVEIKNSVVGKGAKVPHLSYIGDSEIGAGTNIGAGNITANYDGVNKHRTVIGKNVHTGADTTFVAPVQVADDVMTGAGSVVTEDIPAGALGIARCRQKNVEGFTKKKLGSKRGGGNKEE